MTLHHLYSLPTNPLHCSYVASTTGEPAPVQFSEANLASEQAYSTDLLQACAPAAQPADSNSPLATPQQSSSDLLQVGPHTMQQQTHMQADIKC
jgi:hypothetical protein